MAAALPRSILGRVGGSHGHARPLVMLAGACSGAKQPKVQPSRLASTPQASFNLKSLPLAATPLASLASLASSIRSMTTAASVGSESHLAPLVTRIHLLEQKLEGSSARNMQSIQACQVEAEKCRVLLEELIKQARTDGEAMKRAVSTHMTLSALFLVYLFTVCTWMLLLLTDLSGHMHGIPVVRMVAVKSPEGKTKAGQVDIKIAPEDGLVDLNTNPEPHLTTSK